MGRYDKTVDEMVKHLEREPSAETLRGREELWRRHHAEHLAHSAHELRRAAAMLDDMADGGNLTAAAARDLLRREVRSLTGIVENLRGPF